MKPIIGILLILAVVVFHAEKSNAQSREEFNGPYTGWADVKKRFGAKGNGKDDDTRALQEAIDNLSNPVTKFNMDKGAYMTIYLPAGTYCISSTLSLKGKIGVNIIGEDPAKTTIKWIGKDLDTMLLGNGSAYYRIARITWDGNSRKDMEGVGIHWKDYWRNANSQSFAPLNIEIADCFFIGKLKCGIGGGTYGGSGVGANDSEVTIRRCVFEGCVTAGVQIWGFNALDYWIWDCRFLNCGIGVDCHHGNYHVYRSYFKNTAYTAVHNDNGYYTSVRGSYSENSYGFSNDAGVSSNPFKRIFQNNIMLNMKNFPIQYYHLGKVTLWHNYISKSQDTSLKHIAGTGSWFPGIYETMSIGNTYEVKSPVRNLLNPYKVFQIKDISAQKLNVPSAAAFLSTMDPIPIRKSRKVFEVPAGADAAAIQRIINQASGMKGQRPVIHFGVGTWYIDKTLIIPEGSDMQLTGDGLLYATVIARSKNMISIKNAPLLIVKGPTYITIRDIQFIGEPDRNVSAAIQFLTVDQPSAQVHIDQIYSKADTSLIADRLDYLYIEKNNSFFSDGSYLRGGALTKQGKGTAKVCFFGGQFAKLMVNDGARLISKDCWWEGSARTPIDLKGSGEISIDGAMIAPAGSKDTTTASIRIAQFNGKVSLMNMYVHGPIAVQPGNAKLDFLLWNINFYRKLNSFEYVQPGTAARMALMGVNAQCLDNKTPCETSSIPDKFYRVNDVPDFLEKMTAFDRATKPVLYRNLPSGVSNIFISRVSIGDTRQGLVFTK